MFLFLEILLIWWYGLLNLSCRFMIWDDLIVFNWEVTQQRGMLPVQVVRVRGVTNICEDENLYNLVLLIFYYWISFQQQSLTVPWFHPATESVCHIDKKMSVVSCNPWCTLGCLVCSLLLFNFYFSCAPGGLGGWGRDKSTPKSPLIFHRCLNMTVSQC